MTAVNQAISITNLRLKFPGEPSLLFKDLSFAALRGQKVLLLGPSGCGKSTFLQVLSGIIPRSVEVPMKAEEQRLPESWGMVFQDPETQFCMSYVDEELAFVLENLSVSRAEMEDRMRDVLMQVGLVLDELHVPIASLSQGMKQRLALASVLLMQPDVLFLDEPTALLDPEGTVQIWESVKTVAANKTVLIVEHKIPHILDWVDRVLLFNHEGRIIADGSPSDVFMRYKPELLAYGIWYPDVWTDHLVSPAFADLRQCREQEGNHTRSQTPLLVLQDFAGYRGSEKKIDVQQAEVYPSEWIAVAGENGAGKSTLLLAITGILRTSGRCKLAPGITPGLVFQNPELQFLTNTVWDEIAYELRLDGRSPSEIDNKVRELIELFGLEACIDRHPYQLSIGQKRRLSVATALAKDQQLLLLDEPTFGQDARNTFAILKLLERLRKQGTAILMVTHDQQVIEHYATKVWQIHKGKLTVIHKLEEGRGSCHEPLHA